MRVSSFIILLLVLERTQTGGQPHIGLPEIGDVRPLRLPSHNGRVSWGGWREGG